MNSFKIRIVGGVGVGLVFLVAIFFMIQKAGEPSLEPHFDAQKIAELQKNNPALYQELLQNFERAKNLITQNPTQVPSWVEIALMSHQLGDLTLAEMAYKKAISLDAQLFLARSNLAALYRERGEYEKTLIVYREILNMYPTEVQTLDNVVSLYKEGKRVSKEEVVNFLKQGIEQAKDEAVKKELQETLKNMP